MIYLLAALVVGLWPFVLHKQEQRKQAQQQLIRDRLDQAIRGYR